MFRCCHTVTLLIQNKKVVIKFYIFQVSSIKYIVFKYLNDALLNSINIFFFLFMFVSSGISTYKEYKDYRVSLMDLVNGIFKPFT